MVDDDLYQVLRGHRSDVNCVDFTGHSKLISCSNDCSIMIWQLTDENDKFEKHSVSSLLGHAYGVNCVRYSPFGTIIASSSTDGCIILWNSQTGEQVVKLTHDSGSAIRVCSFSPSSALLASGSDDESLVLWDISTRRKIKTMKKHSAMITGCAFTPDSAYLISCSSAGDLKLWDTRLGNIVYVLTHDVAHDLGVLGCDFSTQYEVNEKIDQYTIRWRILVADGPLQSFYTLATCGNDDLVKLWHIRGGTSCAITLSHKLVGHNGNVNCVKFSMDGLYLASAGGDKMVIVWDSSSGSMLRRLEGHKRYVICCSFSDDGHLLASGSNDQTIIIWNLAKIKEKELSINDNRTSENMINLSKRKTSNKLNSKKSVVSDEDVESFETKIMSKWSQKDVGRWLKSIGFEQYVGVFEDNKIDGYELSHITQDTLLTTFGIEPLGHRNKILRGILCLKNPLWQNWIGNGQNDITKPSEFCCPIVKEIMIEPVVAADGHTYERDAIQKWISDRNSTSPMTNEVLANQILIPNLNLRSLIQKFQTTISMFENV